MTREHQFTPPTPVGLPGDGWVRCSVSGDGRLYLPEQERAYSAVLVGYSVDFFYHPDPAPPRPTDGWQLPAPLHRGTTPVLPGRWEWSVNSETGAYRSSGFEPTMLAALAAQEAARDEWDVKLTEHGEVE